MRYFKNSYRGVIGNMLPLSLSTFKKNKFLTVLIIALMWQWNILYPILHGHHLFIDAPKILSLIEFNAIHRYQHGTEMQCLKQMRFGSANDLLKTYYLSFFQKQLKFRKFYDHTSIFIQNL